MTDRSFDTRHGRCRSRRRTRHVTVVSRGGFDRRLTLRLKIREVRVLTDVGDDGLGEEASEVLDEFWW